MKKSLFFIALLFYSFLLFCSQREKKWQNEKKYQNTLEKLIKICLNYQSRLLDQGIFDEDLVLKTNVAKKIEKLRRKNPHLEYRYQAALQRARE